MHRVRVYNYYNHSNLLKRFRGGNFNMEDEDHSDRLKNTDVDLIRVIAW